MPTRLVHMLICGGLLLGSACAQTASGEPRVTVLKGNENVAQQGGIAPDKEQEVILVLQNREVSTSKCYKDVLNEKHDRAFQGTMKVLIALGTTGSATDVRVVGGTLNDTEVASCLVDTLKRFEYPRLEQAGEVQYEFMFRPAY